MANPRPYRPIGQTLNKKQAAEEEILRLRQVLSNTIAQRGKFYKNFFAFTVRFEGDDTSADRDTKNFQDMLRLIGISSVKVIVLEKADKTPAFTLSYLLRDLFKQISVLDGRTLLIGHYAGHGAIDAMDRLFFFDSPRILQKVSLKSFEELYDETTEDLLSQTDVLMIFDSCFSGLATRGLESGDRSVEIISSVGSAQKAHGNSPDLARVQNRTFTSRLADEVARRVGRGATTISFAQVIDDLRCTSQPERKPQYKLQVGSMGMRVPVRGATQTPESQTGVPSLARLPRQQSGSSKSYVSASSSIASTATVIFKVHLKESRTDSVEVVQLIEWLYSLNENIDLELSGVYESNCCVILLLAPWFMWAELQGLQGFSFVEDTLGGNKLSRILTRTSQDLFWDASERCGRKDEPQDGDGKKFNISEKGT
jgi:hypothetical protein